MKIHRFLGSFNFNNSEVELTDKKLLHQLSSVLRMKPGSRLELINHDGSVALAELIKVNSELAEAKILEILPEEREGREVVLFMAILKKENFELVVQKATEIGVTTIYPVITGRTVKTGLNKERLQKIIIEATEQSGRRVMTKLGETINFEKALKIVEDFHYKVFFDQSGDEVRSVGSRGESIALFIGPEGGWEEGELITAREIGFQFVSLGKTILRAETAAIIASYLGLHGS